METDVKVAIGQQNRLAQMSKPTAMTGT